MRFGVSRVGTLLALGLLVGCGPFGPGPDVAAKAWMQAYATQDGNALADLTCDADQGRLQQGMLFDSAAMVLTSGLLGGAKPQVDVTALQYQTTSQSGSDASVHVTGRMRVAILGMSQAQDVDTSMPMRYEHGKWRFCQ